MTMYLIRCLTILVIINVEVSSASSYDYNNYIEGQSWFFDSIDNGTLEIVDLRNGSSRIGKFISIDDVLFRLYTRNGPDSNNVVHYLNSNELKTLNFNPTNPTKFIIHGWKSNGLGDVNTIIRSAYFRSFDVNVICVDWGSGSEELYTVAVINTKVVASALTRFTDWLVKEGANIEDFHYIGHSLGAHISGKASRLLNSGKMPYITALDPAFPLWPIWSQRLRVGDAKYLEVIHTNAGVFGIPLPIGDNDFYPNGGTHMAGCDLKDFGCSHSMSYKYFAYSIGNRNFNSIQCHDYGQILTKKCSNLTTLWMGGDEMKPLRGIFYLETSNNPPYFLN